MRDRLRGRRSNSIKGRSSSTTTTTRSSTTSTTRSSSKRRSSTSSTSRSSKSTLSSEQESFDSDRFKRNDALPTTEGPDKNNQALGSESSVMIGKTKSTSMGLRLTKKVNEMVEKKMATGQKSFEKLSLDRVEVKPAKLHISVKGPSKERLKLIKTPLKQRIALTTSPLKKRIELIKRAQNVEEDISLVKKETCSTKITR